MPSEIFLRNPSETLPLILLESSKFSLKFTLKFSRIAPIVLQDFLLEKFHGFRFKVLQYSFHVEFPLEIASELSLEDAPVISPTISLEKLPWVTLKIPPWIFKESVREFLQEKNIGPWIFSVMFSVIL